MFKYKLIGTLKSGATVTMAVSNDFEEIKGIMERTATEMCDPTISKYVVENNWFVTSVKDIAAMHIEEEMVCL